MDVKRTEMVNEVLRRVKQRGLFNGIVRYQYTDYDIEDSLAIVDAIGKSRNPAFVIDDENRFAYEQMIRWCHCDVAMKAIDPVTKKVIAGNPRKGIYIAGNTGSGKSWCLEVMAAYAMAFGFVITLGDAEKRMLYWDNYRADEICDAFVNDGTFQSYKTRKIYGIQDLGQEPEESIYMGNRLNVIRQLIEFRGDRTDLMTLITSNHRINSDFILRRYGDRVASRLLAMCNYIEIKGKDRRL